MKKILMSIVMFPAAVFIWLKKQRLLVPALLGVLLIAGGVASATFFSRIPKALEAANTPAASQQTAAPDSASGISAAASREPSAAPTTTASPTPSPTPEAEPVEITLTFAGDCTLGMDSGLGYSGSFNEMYEERGEAYFLENVRSLLGEDDLTVVNFEGTLTNREDRADKTYAFKGDPAYAGVLTAGSVELCNLANNHSEDYGEESLRDTKAALEAAGLGHFGGEDVLVTEVKGVKVGFFGLFTVFSDQEYETEIQDRVQKLRDMGAQLIVANFHWGLEDEEEPISRQILEAHAAINAGAHLVIGTHPHVIQGMELYKGRYICYCLGNFCFGGNYNPTEYDCMLFRQTFTVRGDQVDEDGNVSIYPCQISSTTEKNDYRPTLATGDTYQSIWEKIRSRSAALGEENPLDGLNSEPPKDAATSMPEPTPRPSEAPAETVNPDAMPEPTPKPTLAPEEPEMLTPEPTPESTPMPSLRITPPRPE